MLIEYFKLFGKVESTLQEWQRQLNILVKYISYLIYGKIIVTTKIASATLNGEEYGLIICDSATPINITLPTAVDKVGFGYRINNINVGAVTLLPTGAETIQRQVSIALAQDDSLSITSDGVNWYES
jgi:hypothetical protein